MSKRLYFFIGTTTELIRISPTLKELRRRHLPFKIIASGQNTIHTQQLHRYLPNLKIDITLKPKGNESSAWQFALWSFQLFFIALFRLKSEFDGATKQNTHLVIFGDPVSTSIGAIIAKIYGLNLVHLESGDLSFNLLEPFPEEICRHINIHLADVLFPPGDWAMANLQKIPFLTNQQINTYYNTQTEVFSWAIKTKPSPEMTKLIKKLGKYYLLIMHRQEHVFFRPDWTKNIIRQIIEKSDPKLKCVMFDHPLSQEIVNQLKPRLTKTQQRNITTLSLLTYSDFLHLMNHAQYIASDSATNQYEAYLMGKPYLALRQKIEQIEGLDQNVIVSHGKPSIINRFLKHYTQHRRPPVTPTKRPSKIIADYLAQPE